MPGGLPRIPVIAAVAILLTCSLMAVAVRGHGYVGDGLPDGLEPALRTLRGEATDLVVAPGTRGFIDSLHTGPQFHEYDEIAGRTTILDEVWLGHRAMRFPVAQYDGPPSRDVRPEQLRRVEIPYSFLFVRHEKGGPYEEGLVLAPGTTTVEAKDRSRHEVTLAPGEIAWCTVTPVGVVVDETSAP